MTPELMCPICHRVFIQLVKGSQTIPDPDDMASHFWWHKLEKLKNDTKTLHDLS